MKLEEKPALPPKKEKYEPPIIKEHGSLKELTQAKGGAKADGGGVPRTRM